VMLAIAAVVLAGFAVLVPSGSGSQPVATVVADPASFELPKPGTFGGEVVVYGKGAAAGTSPADLGCRLVSRTGREQSSAKLSSLTVIGDPPVTVDDEQLAPLFAVQSYPSGSRVECDSTGSVEPLAVGGGSTFGGNGGLVRAFAGVGAVTCLVLALVGVALTRRRA
jgi:hypothetical protein